MKERNLQQHQQNDLAYSPTSPHWTTTATPVLRSPWSAPSLKQSPNYGNRNGRPSRNKSQSSSHDMDYSDEPLDRFRPTSHGTNPSSGMSNYYHYYNQEHQQDYGKSAHVLDTQSSYQRSMISSQQLQQPLHDVEQPYTRHRRISLSSYTDRHAFSAPSTNNYNMKNFDRLVATENFGIDHQNQYTTSNKDQGRVQRGLRQQQQQIAPTLIKNKRSPNYRQEPAHHHYYAAHSGWKMSNQCNHPSPKSSLSPTPPFLYNDTTSSSATSYTTLSSSSSAAPIPSSTENLYHHHHRRRNSNGTININGATNHRRKSSVDGSNQIMDYPHRQKQSILASSSTTTTTSSLSSSSGSANYSYPTVPVKPTATNSIEARYRHSYSDYYNDQQQQNPCQNVPAERTRRYSQGDFFFGNTKQKQTAATTPANPSTTNYAPIPRRVSTPKLRRVCSAKPYMEKPFPPSQGVNSTNGNNNNSDNGGDNDLFATTMDASSLPFAIRQLATTNDDFDYGAIPVVKEKQASPNFWNPRSEKDIILVKQTLSRRIRGLLLPQRNKLDITVSNDQRMEMDYNWSLARPLTPANELSFDNDAILEDQENGVRDNPFYMISQSWDIADRIGLSFNEDDFISVDTYASSIQQMDPSLTPKILSQQLLTRPYRRDIYRLRTIFTWIIQNIGIVDQSKSTETTGGQRINCNDNDDDNEATTTATAATGPMAIVTNTIQPSKMSLRQRLTTRRNASIFDQDEELEMPAVDVMHGDGLLPEGGGNVDSFDDWLFSESAQQVLLRRECSSSIGLANLFYEMATAAGYRDVRVVYGYLRAPKDSISTACMDDNNEGINADMDDNDNVILIQNHAWCCVKVEGEYRFVDCWLASPFQPQNNNKMEHHWFLTKPTDLIYTHFPQESVDQCLEPTIQSTTFFALPYVWAPFFIHNIKMIRYNPNAITLVDDQVCHLVFRVDPNVTCFAFVEMTELLHSGIGESATPATTMRCLIQSRMVPHKNGSLERIYKIKAVLPPGHDNGWLKIYAGYSTSSPSISNGCTSSSLSSSSGASSTRQEHHHNSANNSNNNNNGSPMVSLELPPLALCFRLTVQQHAQHHPGGGRIRAFEFVHLHPCRHEFYIREPQCYQLYPLHTYNFFIRGDDMHHKLAIKSPGGKLYKLMYYPQEHTYDGSVKISEIGKWSLISLSNHAGGWSVVATWECRT